MIAIVTRCDVRMELLHAPDDASAWDFANELAEDPTVFSADIFAGSRHVAGVLPSDGIFAPSPWVQS